MTNRERAMNILHYKSVDRFPAVHFGYWRELLAEWAALGKIPVELSKGWSDGNPVDKELDKLIGWDFDWTPLYSPRNGLFPAFEEKVLEVLPDGTKRTLNADGLIQRFSPGVVSIPAEDDYLLKDREAFETLYKPKMQFTPERINYEYLKDFNTEVYDKLDYPVGLGVGSAIGTIRSMESVVGMSYLLYDEDEDLFGDIIDTFAELQYQCTKAVLETGAHFDFAHYWEDICFNSGPLLNPKIIEKYCRKHYERRNELLHSYGIDIISLDCDGVTRDLQELWVDTGVNVLFPIEVGTWGDQFGPARRKYGKRQLGVGGFNKLALREDKAAVDKELERIRPLAMEGGYLPCPDHRLMPGTKFELVQYYAEEIKKLKI